MKKIILLLILCQSYLFSQDFNQETINGKIIIEGNDIGGITIYNTNSKLGTITNENGEFAIKASLNDLIQIKSLVYHDLDITINKTILKSRKLRVFLIEEITKLDEIIISSSKLTGNFKEDVKRTNSFTEKLDDIYFGVHSINQHKVNAKADLTQTPVVKPLGEPHVDGLNIVNVVDQLLIPLFRSEVVDKKTAGIPSIPAKSIKYYLGSNFLMENFKIPEHRVEEFIRYVEDDTFNIDLLNYGHEMEFLELLTQKSKLFLKE